MIHTERPPCQLNFQTLYCIQLLSGRDGGKRNGVDEQRNYQKEGHHAAGWGVSKFLSLSARERAEQSPRDTFYRGRLGRPVCSSQHPVACALADASSTTLEIKLRRGAFFMPSCRSKRPPTGPGWEGGQGAPARTDRPPGCCCCCLLLRNVVAADLRRTAILVDKLPKLSFSTAHTPCVTFDARPFQ